MIKTKLKSIINAREAARRLAGQVLPVAVSYRVAKLIKALNDELTTYEAERVKLCENCGTLDKARGKYVIEKGEVFEKEYNSLLDFDVELAVNKITLPDTLSISPSDLISLSDFVQIEGVTDD